MDDLVFLSQRIPYPPNKGDKLRSWPILVHLAKRFRVHLACFIDDPSDMAHREVVARTAGGDCLFRPLHPTFARVKSLPALFTRASLTEHYFNDSAIARWLDQRINAARPVAAFVFASSMAPYVLGSRLDPARAVLDMVDVDSDKWRQYADRLSGPARWVYRREARALLDLERRAASAFGATMLVTPAEAALFARLAPETAARVRVNANGVDLDYFSPREDHANPYPHGELAIAFTGAMDYWPNVDAAIHFARDIMPAVVARHPAARFSIVGANPTDGVRALAGDLVRVTGRVPDMRPYLAHAALAVVPLRIARGVQNKVLEAMAMARPVVASPHAAAGIAAVAGRDLLVAGDAAAFAAAIDEALGRSAELGAAGRAYVEAHHDWAKSLAAIDALIDAVRL